MSTLLSSDDLNDFIKPSVACIKPQPVKPKSLDSSIQIGEDGDPLEVFTDGSSKSLEPAQISLSDCLACSGCITSAEEILVAQHSHKELLNKLKNNNDNLVFVASISHQSRASLATAFNVPMELIDCVLMDLFVTKLGFSYIVGTELGRLFSLHGAAQEIREYKQKNHKNRGPLMSSVCPGWILYVEKTHPEMISNLSQMKSPQQITGCLLKNSAAHDLQISKNKVYHLSIMPCFDKKLEAARPEDDEEVDVDCVITAKELVQLLQEEDISLEQYIQEFSANNNINEIINSIDLNRKKYSPELFKFGAESWWSNLGSCSGGYAENYLAFLQQHHPNPTEIVEIKGRNEDIFELHLQDTESKEKIGSVAVVNGFRNIQNLIRKVNDMQNGKTGKKKGALVRRKVKTNTTKEYAQGTNCDFVEVMACPGGCINGGGQISAPQQASTTNTVISNINKKWKDKTTEKYKTIPTISDVNQQDLVDSLVAYMKDFEKFFSVSHDRVTKTSFKQVEPMETSAIALTAKW